MSFQNSCSRRSFVLSVTVPLVPFRALSSGTIPDARREEFLKTAEVVSVKKLGRGVTGALRAVLRGGGLTHEAQIQMVNNRLPPLFAPDNKPIEWLDSYRYNIAAYRLDRLLGLRMVPVSVGRRYRNRPAAFTWWADNVLMMEQERVIKKITPPDPASWKRQASDADVFDELIFNTDRNLGNILVTKDWRMILIDHTRAFAAKPLLRQPEKVKSCNPKLLTAMRNLTLESVRAAVGGSLTSAEINSLMARRDLVVERLSR